MVKNLSSDKLKRVRELKNVVLWCMVLLMAGCGYVEVRPVNTKDVEGIRSYHPWPYLWVMQAKQGGCTMTLQYLPDSSREYVIIPHIGIGSPQINPTLTEGWNLTAMNIAADSKVSEMVTSIAGMTGTIASPKIARRLQHPPRLAHRPRQNLISIRGCIGWSSTLGKCQI